ncbi:hypothetical protein [Rhodococcus daqingensis]|uniref:DUF1214 domain-containing protein n=1 Tax=Rhodococcus daqingensis TaxID=2479363 RepID=A0ABW2S0Z7_9NOCA
MPGNMGGLGSVGELGQANGGVLATDGQRALEARARQILATDVVQNQIRRVQALYAGDPQGAKPAGKATVDRAANAIGAAAVLYTVTEDTDRPVVLWGTTMPHEFAGLSMPRSGYGIDNPDNIYRHTMVAGDSTYVIRGRKTNPGPTDLNFEMRDAIPGTTALTAEGGVQLATLTGDAITSAPDGSFVITIDAEPANGRPNHMQIPADGTSMLIVRDLLNDWSRENPVQLEIARVDGPPAAPERTIDQQATEAAEILSKIAPFWVTYFNQYYYNATPPNVVRPVRQRPGARGLSTGGWFSLADDEALVITVDPIGAGSTGIQLSDPWGVAYEYRDRTSSLNTTQAKPNPGGTYT